MGAEGCSLVVEDFIIIGPPLDMVEDYGWSAGVLVALVGGVVGGYRVNMERVHGTGFLIGELLERKM